MIFLRTFGFGGVLLAVLTGATPRVLAAEHIVTKMGWNANAGTTRAATFATILHGANALRLGDTLTIWPGEYHEAVKRIDLRSADRDTATPVTESSWKTC